MPELPEVEITARLVGAAAKGAVVESAIATAVSTLKTFDPPITELSGKTITGIGRRGKHLVIEFSGDLSLLVHLMSAGRLQLFEKRGSLRDKISRILVRLDGGRELRLREFGTKQRAWAKLMKSREVKKQPEVASLGPDAWPDPPAFKEILKEPRPLHAVLRDQKVIAGIGRSWVDEILHEVRMSPFKRADGLTQTEYDELRAATIDKLGMALAHYEKELSVPLPDKFPMPLTVHRNQGKPCPRCETKLEAIYFDEHTITYCPSCQTGGKILKDRRLSKLLK